MQPNAYTDPNGYSAPVYAPQRTPHKPVNPFMIVSFVEIVAFCIMIAVFFNVGQNTVKEIKMLQKIISNPLPTVTGIRYTMNWN